MQNVLAGFHDQQIYTTIEQSTGWNTISIAQTGTNGPKINYTLLNSGTDTWNWTVTEVNCDGSANDYPWLSVAPASGNTLAGNTSTQIVATTNTTSLVAGPQTGYLKFTRSCSPAGCLSASRSPGRCAGGTLRKRLR